MKRRGLWALISIATVLIVVLSLGVAPQATAQGDTLTKTYTTISGVTFNYPEGWIVTENVDGDYTMIELDNLPSVDEKDLQSALEPGETKIGFYMAPASQMFADMGLPADATPEQILTMLLDPSIYSFGHVSEATIGGAPAARVDGSANDNRFDFVALFGQLSDGTAVIVQANTARGEMQNFETTIMAVCDSITTSNTVPLPGSEPSQNGELSQIYEDPGGMIVLNYPEGWIADKYFGTIFIANSQAALDGEITTVEAGEFRMDLKVGAAYEIGLPESGTALEMAQAVWAEVQAEPNVSYVTDPEVLDVLSYDAAGMLVNRGSAEMVMLVITADAQHAVLLTAAAPQGELSQYEETFLAILQSIQFIGDIGSVTEEPSTDIPTNNDVNWQTETVSLSADNFYIIANGQIFTADVDGVEVDSDPGDAAYTTLEIEWEEHGVPMRLYIYFESDGNIWQSFEIRTYDGSSDGEWITYEGTSFTEPLGKAYQMGSFAREYYGNGVYFQNLTVQAFTSVEVGAEPPAETTEEPAAAGETMAAPATLSGPENCRNVAVSIGDYSSQYSESYTPANLLDGDPTTGWSSAGDPTQVEYVVINLDGIQTVYGILFNSYSTSAGYEADSIQDFSIETITGGQSRLVFKGQAALEQGYQSYTFDPVETDHLRFLFTGTHGGSYFEAADIMICAVEDSTPVATPAGQEIRQWASQAMATSQYADSDWSAAQATGAPDTPACGDFGTAWASSTATGIDELLVLFDTPVLPTQINIYQSYNPGAISRITLLEDDGGEWAIPDSADPGTNCPGIFSVAVPEGLTGGHLIDGVLIIVDQSSHTGWNEIDAVELVGYATTTTAAPANPDTPLVETQPLPEALSCVVVALRDANLRSGPGTDYNVAGQLTAGTSANTNGQADVGDGYTWRRLTSGAWVRSDLVELDAECNMSTALPLVTADDPLPLTQRYTTPQGYSFNYPQDWTLIEESGGATIGNGPDTAEKPFGDPYAPGEFQISIRWMTAEDLAPDTGLTAGATPMQLLKAAISVSSGIDLGEPYELAIGDNVVAAAYGKFMDMEVQIGVIIFDAGNGMYGSVLTGSDLNGLDQFEPTVRAIVASTLISPSGVESASPAPAGSPAVQVNQTFEAYPDYTVMYPEGWAIADNSPMVMISNNAAFIELGTFAKLETGVFILRIFAPWTLERMLTNHGLEQDATLADIAQQVAMTYVRPEGEPIATTVNGREAARVNTTYSYDNEEGFVVVWFVDDERVGVAIAEAYTGEIAQFEDLAFEIIGTVRVVPEEGSGGEVVAPSETGALAQNHTTQDGQISFGYPEGWFVYEDLNIPYIYNSPEAQSALSIGLKSGQVALQITQNVIPGAFGADPSEHIIAFTKGLVDYLNLTQTATIAITINGHSAAYALATSDSWSLWGIAVVVADDRMIEVLAYTAPGEFGQYEPDIMAIVESVVYTP